MRKMLFDKYADNPVLTAAQFPSDIMYVMNPGAIKFNGEYLLLVDAATTSTPIIFWIARSKDGIHFTPDPEPVDWPAHRYHETCVFDIRVTELEGVYYLMYCSMTKERGVALGLVKTTDFVHYERIEQADMGYEFRNGVLFPEKINGRYVRLDRPMPQSIDEPAGMCISYSDDLMHW
ncbi:MAG: glycosidase, partial [Lentisphaeria bacterium]|nr:glycosidase [Lentisphaeria bacterium]